MQPLTNRPLITLGTGTVLVVMSLLFVAQLNLEMRDFSNSFASMFRGLSGIAGLVSALGRLDGASRPSPGSQWNWRHVQELYASESLRNAKLSPSEKRAIAEAVSAQLRPGMSGLEIESEDRLQAAAMDTRVRVMDLNLDGVGEIVAQAMVSCSATGNCPFGIFRKTGARYHSLLEAEAQTFTVQKSGTNGFKDILLGLHGSATESTLTEYKFREGTYEETGCYEARYIPAGSDKARGIPEPIVSPCKSPDIQAPPN